MKPKTVLLTCAVLATIGLAQAQRPLMEPAPQPLGRLVEALDLTAEQRARIKQIIQHNRQQVTEALQARAAATQAFRSAVQAGDPDRIRAAAGELGRTIGDLAVIRAQNIRAIKEVLTPEQRDRLDAMLKQGREGPRPPEGIQRPLPRGPRPRPDQPQGARPRIDQRQGPGMPRDLRSPAPDRRLFRQMDTDRDGLITPRELKAYLRGPKGRPERVPNPRPRPWQP